MNVSRRIQRTFVHHVEAPRERVFPLLCPVREHEWIEGWSADVVFSRSGVAEDHCVFTTDHGGERTTWVINAHDPRGGRVSFTLFERDHVQRLDVAVFDETPSRTRLEWTRTYTALNDEGAMALEHATGAALDARMVKLQSSLRHFLATGTCLRG